MSMLSLLYTTPWCFCWNLTLAQCLPQTHPKRRGKVAFSQSRMILQEKLLASDDGHTPVSCCAHVCALTTLR